VLGTDIIKIFLYVNFFACNGEASAQGRLRRSWPTQKRRPTAARWLPKQKNIGWPRVG